MEGSNKKNLVNSVRRIHSLDFLQSVGFRFQEQMQCFVDDKNLRKPKLGTSEFYNLSNEKTEFTVAVK